MRKLAVSIPVLNQPQSTQETLDSLKSRQSQDIQYIIIDNGSTPPVREWLNGLTTDDIVIRNDKNVGLPKALNQAMAVCDADYIFHTHTDVTMYEQDWDLMIIKAIEEANATGTEVGLAGFFGAIGIGTNDIYKTPYVKNQLVRVGTMAGNRCKLDPAVHHHSVFMEPWRKCAVTDGFALIVKNEEAMRFDESFGPHHAYDSDTGLRAYNAGYQAICINIDVMHHGGRTDIGEDWATDFGKTRQQVHDEAHVPFYEKWRPGKNNICMPFRI